MTRLFILALALTTVVHADPQHPRDFYRVLLQRDNARDPGRYVGQTAVHRYRHPRRKDLSLTMVCTVHIAPVEYYRSLTALTRKADIVLYENPGYSVAGGAEFAGGDPARKKVIDRLHWITRLSAAESKLLGYRAQSDWERAIHDSRWHPCDLNSIQLMGALKRFGPVVDAERMSHIATLEKTVAQGTDAEKAAARRRVFQPWIEMFNYRAKSKRTKADIAMANVSAVRDQAMWDKVMRTVTGEKHKKIVVIFGAAHGRPLAKRLKSGLGMFHRSTTWHDFFTLEKNKKAN